MFRKIWNSIPWCKLFGHNWEYVEITRKIIVKGRPEITKISFPTRTCEVCNKLQARTTPYILGGPTNNSNWHDYKHSNKVLLLKPHNES